MPHSDPAFSLSAPDACDGIGIPLRRVLQAALGQPSATKDFRPAIRAVCEDAHRRRLRAEQVVVALKETWAVMPEVALLPRGGPRDELLGQFITICIEEFYATE